MFEKDKREVHESFGLIQLSRVSRGGEVPLFGSSIKHSNSIMIRVMHAEKQRHLNNDHYFDRGLPIVEIEMSQSQFAQFITNPNSGTGTPVTIRSIEGKRMANCPEENKRLEFENEFNDTMKNIARRIDALTEKTKQILSGTKPPNKGEKEEILKELAMIKQQFSSNVPFIYEQFNEQMDKTVLEAKGEMEAFLQNKVQSLGIEGLKNIPSMITSGQRKEEEQQ